MPEIHSLFHTSNILNKNEYSMQSLPLNKSAVLWYCVRPIKYLWRNPDPYPWLHKPPSPISVTHMPALKSIWRVLKALCDEAEAFKFEWSRVHFLFLCSRSPRPQRPSLIKLWNKFHNITYKCPIMKLHLMPLLCYKKYNDYENKWVKQMKYLKICGEMSKGLDGN